MTSTAASCGPPPDRGPATRGTRSRRNPGDITHLRLVVGDAVDVGDIAEEENPYRWLEEDAEGCLMCGSWLHCACGRWDT
ncbi:hypothetical protein ABT354_01900 [Streptomyces sp. NPDC000594]|uniref:hypothetical protein n=1 Tax=Streptomyces sp. NPDC000594 TaxID=3154261 RepID=UPI00331C8DF9